VPAEKSDANRGFKWYSGCKYDSEEDEEYLNEPWERKLKPQLMWDADSQVVGTCDDNCAATGRQIERSNLLGL
jgi:hypothetical protein